MGTQKRKMYNIARPLIIKKRQNYCTTVHVTNSSKMNIERRGAPSKNNARTTVGSSARQKSNTRNAWCKVDEAKNGHEIQCTAVLSTSNTQTKVRETLNERIRYIYGYYIEKYKQQKLLSYKVGEVPGPTGIEFSGNLWRS